MRTITVGLLSFLGRFLLTFIACTFFWATVPTVVGLKSTTVVSESMHPKIQLGDIVFSKKLSENDSPLGKISLFVDPVKAERLVFHRLIEDLEDNTYLSKGDNNPTVDQTPVPKENVLGVGVIRIPAAGFFYYWIQNEQWKYLIISALILIFAVFLATLPEPKNKSSKLTQ